MITQISDNVKQIQKGFNEYRNNQYDYWFYEGRKGNPYDGKTYVGFHGWYWENKEFLKETK